MLRWIPNALTALRLLLLPVLVTLLEDVPARAVGWSLSRSLAIGLFAFMAATDWLDGYVARRLGAMTRSGSLADAAADRLLLLVPLLYLAVWEPVAFSAVPLWLPLWIMGLDMMLGLTLARAHRRRSEGVPERHNAAGRGAMWVLSAVVLWAVAGLPDEGVIVLGVTGAGLATVSGLVYIRRWRTR